MKILLPLLAALLLTIPAPAQNFAPPDAKTPDAAAVAAITKKAEKLEGLLTLLRRHGVRDLAINDIEVCHKAAVWITRHNEFFDADSVAWTHEALDLGLLRASQTLMGDAPWYHTRSVAVVHGYRSIVDGSVQPFAVTRPADYGRELGKKYRVDVILHGRDSKLTEAKFIHQYSTGKPIPREQDTVLIHIFGRGNNAYRWAGETDVLEAITAFGTIERTLGRDELIDSRRLVLRGFSMGGAGTWHLGLHRPDRWCVIGPGAGFTTTRGYIKDLPDPLPPYQEACLHIYDAVDYAENARMVPVVAYSGDQDAQMQAAVNIEQRLRKLDIPMTHLVAPGLGHSFPPEWQKKAEAEYARYAGPDKGREEWPARVQFVTYTLRYGSCAWVHILGLDRHYQKAEIDAQQTDSGYVIKTTNIRLLRLATQFADAGPLRLVIDGQEVHTRPYTSQSGSRAFHLEKDNGRWRAALPQKLVIDQQRSPRKVGNLQGPIDDAFTASFLCVRGTGQPWHPSTQAYAEANLKRFQAEWNRYLRADLPVKDDIDVTEDDITGKHLILFGDPASNSFIEQVVDRLPLTWTEKTIAMGGQTHDAATHVPMLIYPNPLNTGHYVVLNSGHTFHEADFRGTNALLYPRLGDYAVLQLKPTEKDPLGVEVKQAGLFNDSWRIDTGRR